MGFHQDCVLPGLGDDKSKELLSRILYVFIQQSSDVSKNVCFMLWCFPLSNHLEIYLQNGSVFCIWSRASHLSAVRVLGVGLLTGETSGVISSGTVELSAVGSSLVWLLVFKVGPSAQITVSMLNVVTVAGSHFTNLERQSAALFLAPGIHSNVMLLVANSSPHLLTLLFAFFPFKNFARGLWSFLTMISAPWRQ